MRSLLIAAWLVLHAFGAAAPAETMASAIDHYRKLGADASLRLIGRVGSFGASVEGLALSRNGKFLAVCEGGTYDTKVHVWDVAAEQFVGQVATHKYKLEEFFGNVPPFVSIAVSNDGKYVALSRQFLLVVEVESAKFKVRTTKTDELPGDNDAVHVAFSEDDALLFTILRDGRIVSRDTQSWKIKGTLKGMESYARGLRISGDGEFVTGRGPNGPFLWTKETKKAAALKSSAKVKAGFRWSARPEFEHYATAVSHLDALEGGGDGNDDPNSGEAFSENISSIEVRKYENPDTVWKRLTNAERTGIFGVETLGPGHVAATIMRRGPSTGKERFLGGAAEWGLRVWNISRQAIVAEAFLPSSIWDTDASDDGRVLATLVEREHVVHLWRFNPKGTLDRKYAKAVEWAPPTPLRWESIASEKQGKISLSEKDGSWTLARGGGNTRLKEKSRTQTKIVLEGDRMEHHLFNTGTYWTLESGRGDPIDYAPNFLGYRHMDVLKPNKERWKLAAEGVWHASELKPIRSTMQAKSKE